MKKLLATLLAVIMLFTFCACGSSDQEQTGLDGTDKTEATDTDTASGSDLKTDPDAPRYTSDGELIVEEDIPASNSDLSE